MKYVLINSWCRKGSTGKIVYNFYSFLKSQGHEALFFHGREQEQEDKSIIRITSKMQVNIHGVLSRITGLQGWFSTSNTKKMIRRIEQFKPDFVYLFNLHGYYLNEKLLLEYLKKSKIKTVYMLFDEYPYLGKCCFSESCNKFENECGSCPLVKEYPKSVFFDTSKKIFNMKKQLYSGWNTLNFAGVEYTRQRAKKSALAKNIPYHSFNMGVDIQTIYSYKPFDEVAEKYGIDTSKKIALTVGFSSDNRKGIDKFIKLASMVGDEWLFINIGYDKALVENAPENFKGISYVGDQNEMAQFYSMADLYVSTSSGEAMSNACLEALGCSTPIAAFDVSGMSYLAKPPIGRFAKPDDFDELCNIIKNTEKKNEKIKAACREYALTNYTTEDFMKNLLSASADFKEVL